MYPISGDFSKRASTKIFGKNTTSPPVLRPATRKIMKWFGWHYYPWSVLNTRMHSPVHVSLSVFLSWHFLVSGTLIYEEGEESCFVCPTAASKNDRGVIVWSGDKGMWWSVQLVQLGSFVSGKGHSESTKWWSTKELKDELKEERFYAVEMGMQRWCWCEDYLRKYCLIYSIEICAAWTKLKYDCASLNLFTCYPTHFQGFSHYRRSSDTFNGRTKSCRRRRCRRLTTSALIWAIT